MLWGGNKAVFGNRAISANDCARANLSRRVDVTVRSNEYICIGAHPSGSFKFFKLNASVFVKPSA